MIYKLSNLRNNITKVFLCSGLITIALLLISPAQIVTADVNDFVISTFHAKYELFNDTKGGRLVVTEDITLVYSDNNHGILRALPIKNDRYDTKIEVISVLRDGQNEPHTTYEDNNNNFVIKIGTANLFVTGEHSYQIKYEMQRGIIKHFDDYDEWYWDINGTGWQQEVQKLTGEVILPEEIKSRGYAATNACYTGIQGSISNDCFIKPTANGYTFGANQTLGPHETLTIAIGIPTGIFEAYTAEDWANENKGTMIWFWLIPATFLFSHRIWRKHGKDHKTKGIIVPEYSPPKGMTPAEVGLVFDYKLQSRDISATIVDLAVKKYIKIHDDNKKYFGLIEKHDFSFELLKNDFSALKLHEKDIIKALFPQIQIGEKISLKSLDKATLALNIGNIKQKLIEDLTRENGMFDEHGSKYKKILIGLGIGLLIVAPVVLFVPVLFISLIISALILIFFGIFMKRRTHAGIDAYEKVKGLEIYMKTAESDRLKMMQSVERPYVEPEKSYEFFENLLPYAIALGVEKSWAKQFDTLIKNNPSWLNSSVPYDTGAYIFVSSLAESLGSLDRNFAKQTTSSTSGSSGSGFSGGGSGGGGGGGW
jgi:uncharacterized membrane protein YgcG